MLSSLSRLFQPSTSSLPLDHDRQRDRERDPLAGVEAGWSSKEANTDRASASHLRNASRVSLNTQSDSTPLLPRKQPSHLPSSLNTSAVGLAVALPGSLDATHSGYPYPAQAPSHVFWKPQGQDSPTKSVGSGRSLALTTPTTPGGGSGWGAQPISMNRSASSPSLLLSPSQASASASVSVPSAHQPQRPSSLGRQSSHSHSQSHSNTHSNSNSLRLAVDAMSYASESSDAESEPSSVRNGHVLPKQLSPIHEQQVPFPPHRKLSMDSVPRTPDSTRTFDKLNNAFIHRPLKRSLSQTSTSTHRSNISAVPPIIPPLDLRPNFQSVMGVQQNPNSPAVAQGPTGGSIAMTVPIPRKSRLPVPNLPTVIGSPRQMNMVSVIYEDGASASARTSSFITAPSVSLNTPNGEQRRFSFGNVDVMFDPSSFASDSARDSGQTQHTQRTETDAARTVETEETDATHRAHPPPAGLSGMYDDDLSGTDGEQDYGQLTQLRPHSGPSVRPRNPTPSSTHSRSHSRPDSLAIRDSHLAVPRSRTPTDESFLEQRWLKGTSFGSERFALPPSVQRQQRRDAREITYACILFWAGFVMPWCWLIGGWLLTRAGDVSEDERGSVLPLWQRHRHRSGYRRARRSNVDETAAMAGQNSGSGGKRRAGSNRHGDPEVSVPLPAEKRMKAKMWYPLLAPSVESLAPSDADSTHRMKRSKRTRPDPWIRRCRVAAMVSGILIFAAFVVAIVLVAGVRM